MSLRIFFRLLFAVILALILLALLSTLYKGYNGSIESILSIVNTRKSGKDLSTLISADRFRKIQLLLAAVIAGLALLIWKFNEVYASVTKYAASLFQFTKSLVVTSIRSENKYILLIPVVASFYYAIIMPILYDEGLTYLYFTSKGILSSLSFYPEPNNHILN